MTMRNPALLASALAVTLSACDNRDFNRPALLDKPRILAVRAEPPQPSFGQAAILSTLLYQPPLDRVADQCPSPGPTTYTWEWCPMPMIASQEANTYVCPFPEQALQSLYAGLGLGAAPPYALGEGETVAFPNPFPAPLLYALCRGDVGSSLGGPTGGEQADAGSGRSIFTCDRPAEDVKAGPGSELHPVGFQVYIKVTVTPACPGLLPAGFSPLTATYALHLPTQDAIPGNQNPVLNGIFATENYNPPVVAPPPAPPEEEVADGGVPTDDGGAPVQPPELDGGQSSPDLGHDGPDGSVPLAEDPVVMVKRDKHVGLQLDVDISTAEHLAVPLAIDYDSREDTIRRYEHLQFSWYAEAGDFSGRGRGRNTGYLPTALPADQDSPPSEQDIANFQFNTTNTWDLPKTEDYSYSTARIVVVVRDGRGGVGWTTKQVSLEDHP
jgi:hypothetical protein